MNRILSHGPVPIVQDDWILATPVNSWIAFLSLWAVTLPAVKQILCLAPFVLPLRDRKALAWAFLSRQLMADGAECCRG